MKRYNVLDGLRGVAASIIAIAHFPVLSHFSQTRFCQSSSLCVDFFFVLSGFVICGNYAPSLKNSVQLFKFIYLRFFRLYPLHLFFCIVMLVEYISLLIFAGALGGGVGRSLIFSDQFSPLSIILNILLLSGIGIPGGAPLNPPSWSISVEFYVYILFSILSILGKRFLIFTSILIFSLSIFILAWSSGTLHPAQPSLIIFRGLVGFFAGVICYFLYENLRILEFLNNLKFVAGAFECAFMIFVIYYIYNLFGPGAWSFLAPIVFAFLILLLSFETGLVSKLLLMKFFQYLGKISYSIYLCHWSVIYLYRAFIIFLQKITGTNILFNYLDHDSLIGVTTIWGDFHTVLYFIVVVLLAHVSYKFIEAPCRIWSRQKVNHKAYILNDK